MLTILDSSCKSERTIQNVTRELGMWNLKVKLCFTFTELLSPTTMHTILPLENEKQMHRKRERRASPVLVDQELRIGQGYDTGWFTHLGCLFLDGYIKG